MSIKETRCIEVECDECGDGWGDEDYGMPHWPVDTDIAQKTSEYGWTTDGGKHYCRHCTATRTCARDGHQPRLLDFGEYPAITICDRCNAFLERTQGAQAMTSASCVGNDPACPCQDGDVCHYVDDPTTGTPAWPCKGAQ